MGIFNGYLKEGAGIDKNAKRKKGLFLFIDILARKFMKLMVAGMLYFIVSLPYLALAYFALSTFVMNAFGITDFINNLQPTAEATQAGVTQEIMAQMLFSMTKMIITVLLFNFFGSGPVGASYAYITRCYTRGEHAWVWSDGWEQFKGNLKQSIPLFVLDFIVVFLAMNAIAFYSQLAGHYNGIEATLLVYVKYFTVMLFVVYGMMHTFIYQIMITYKCSFIELIKFSGIMTIAKLPMSILLAALSIVGVIAAFYFFSNPIAGLLLYFIIGISLLRYPHEFYASRVIEKNIKAVKKQQKKNSAKVTYLDEQ